MATSSPGQRGLGLSWRGNFKLHCQESSLHPFPCCFSDHSSSSISTILNQFSQKWSALAGKGGWEGSLWETMMFKQLLGSIKKCTYCGAPQLFLSATFSPPLGQAVRQQDCPAAISQCSHSWGISHSLPSQEMDQVLRVQNIVLWFMPDDWSDSSEANASIELV